MGKVEIIIIGVIVFLLTGVVAYLLETMLFRHTGRIGSYEGLFEYFKKIDQKNGNIAVIVWGGIWVVLMALTALVIYLAQ